MIKINNYFESPNEKFVSQENYNNFNENLSFVANICQIISYVLNIKQISNDEIMKDLQNQDKILEEQINVYLKKIIEQNDEIIKMLKDFKNGNENELSKQ